MWQARYFRVVFRRWFYFLWQAQAALWRPPSSLFSWQAQHFTPRVACFCESHCQDCVKWWQRAWHFGTSDENWWRRGTKHRFWDRRIWGSWKTCIGKRRVWSCLKIWGSLIRNARFGLPRCLVLILWCSCGVAVPSAEAAKPFIFEGFKSGCTAVLHGRRGIPWHFHGCKKVSKIVLCDRRNTSAGLSENDCHFSWQGQHFGQVHFHFTWRARHFRTLHFTLQLYTPHSTLYTPHLTLYNASHFTLHTLHLALYTLHLTLNTPHLYPLHSTHRTLHLTLHTLHFTLNTLHFTLYTWDYTLHFTLHTLHLALYTLHSTLYTWHSGLCTTLHTL